MKKVLLGCILLAASITTFAESNVLSTLEQLELNFQQLEAEEKAMYEKRKSEAEEAQRTLAQQREMYQKIITQEKRIADVKGNRYYKDQYNQLAKKYAESKRVLEEDMRKQEEIINLFEMIKQRKGERFMKGEKAKPTRGRPLGSGVKKYRILGCRFTREEYTFINKSLSKLRRKYQTNSRVLMELFKVYSQEMNQTAIDQSKLKSGKAAFFYS